MTLVLLYLIFSWIHTTAAVLYLSTNMKSSGFNSFNIISNAFALIWFHFFIFSIFHEFPIYSNLLIRLLTSLLFIVFVVIAFSISGFPFLLILAALPFFMNPSVLRSTWFNWVISPFSFYFDSCAFEPVFIIFLRQNWKVFRF